MVVDVEKYHQDHQYLKKDMGKLELEVVAAVPEDKDQVVVLVLVDLVSL